MLRMKPRSKEKDLMNAEVSENKLDLKLFNPCMLEELLLRLGL